MMSPNPIEQLIKRLSRLPGLGPRSARRAALHLINHRDGQMLPLAEDMLTVAHAIRRCTECGNLDMTSRCGICQDNSRDQKRLCIVEDVADLWAMERAAVFGGRYHVLGGVLSAIDGVGPDTLRLDYLVERTKTEQIEEVILALSATVDGQATAHYIADKMTGLNARITRLAHGVPVGGELDYLDDGTLAQAMKARQQF
ncbi:recombination mediator RecR [Alphaproteobacteria bacterium]|jgi:recombination protein RecR|nr:recombination mediator RecR [Alphaproteobacteria bacterium]